MNVIVLLVDRKLGMLMGHIGMIYEYTLYLKIFKYKLINYNLEKP